MQQSKDIESTSIEWRDTEWIERVGGIQDRQIALDYFSMSPFWDRHCNNEIIHMQTVYRGLRQPFERADKALRNMIGVEFSVEHEQPPLWIIQKRFRTGPGLDQANLTAVYYILGANVYQAPTIYSVLANRLVRS
ncbi:mediator complex, subunit Med6 [Parasitella parasitica]|nr:mediator complex, subunit Med6 [Parasitella parasitica]